MELFEVETENKQEELIWQIGATERNRAAIWPAANQISLMGDFGEMLFQQVKTDLFRLWTNAYRIQKGRSFKAWLDHATIELNMVVKNEFTYKLTPFTKLCAREMQFNLTNTPYMQNTIQFKGEQTYSTFDLHIHWSFLKKIAQSYPWQMDLFMDKVVHNRFATLYPTPQSARSIMIRLYNVMMCRLTENTFDPFILTEFGEAFIREAIYQGENVLKSGAVSKAIEICNKIHRAKAFILINLNRPKTISIKNLERAVAMNRTDLQRSFKAIVGKTIYEYLQYHRIRWAQLLLENHPTLPIKEVSERLGYMNVQGFSGRFSKAVQMAPRDYRNFMLKMNPEGLINPIKPKKPY